MTMMETETEAFDQSSDEDVLDSDEELQEAFARGELQPGLVILQRPGENPKEKEKKMVINNIPVLELKLQQIKLPKKFGWAERLDIVNDVAPLAPEIALQMDEHKTKREREIKFINNQKKKKSSQPSLKPEEDPVHNDFVREMSFYRQGQEAILKCLPRLKELKVPTKRPDDYFAEMAKSDGHMQKVAKVLHKKQVATERADKVRKIRLQKKISKQTQVHVLQERQKAKKELTENIKKYRKGQKSNLDFLDDKKSKGQKNSRGGGANKPMVNRRREAKNERYGTGGPRKGSKYNTTESLDDYGGPSGGAKRGFGGRGGRSQGRGFSSGGRGGSRGLGRGFSSGGRGGGSSAGRGFSSGGRGGGSSAGRGFSSGGRSGGSSAGRGFSSGGRGGGSSAGRGFSSGGRGGSRGQGRGFSSGGRGGGGRGAGGGNRPGKTTRQQNRGRKN